LEKWIEDFTDVAGVGTTIAVAGNKSDLKDQCQVSFADAESWARDRNYLISQTSALTGHGIRSLFSQLAIAIVQNTAAKHERVGLVKAEDKTCKC
jgi:GTPase SAR1 family protein